MFWSDRHGTLVLLMDGVMQNYHGEDAASQQAKSKELDAH